TVSAILADIDKSELLRVSSQDFFVRWQRVKSEVVTPSKYGGGWLNVEFVVAHKNEQWMVQRRFLTDNVSSKERKDIPSAPMLMLTKNDLLFKWQQSSQYGVINQFLNGGDMFQGLEYFSNLGLDIAKPISESNHVDYSKLKNLSALQDDLDQPFLADYVK